MSDAWANAKAARAERRDGLVPQPRTVLNFIVERRGSETFHRYDTDRAYLSAVFERCGGGKPAMRAEAITAMDNTFGRRWRKSVGAS